MTQRVDGSVRVAEGVIAEVPSAASALGQNVLQLVEKAVCVDAQTRLTCLRALDTIV